MVNNKSFTKTSIILVDTDPSLLIFLILMATMLSGPALYILLYLIIHFILWLFLIPIIDEVQPTEVQPENCGEISLWGCLSTDSSSIFSTLCGYYIFHGTYSTPYPPSPSMSPLSSPQSLPRASRFGPKRRILLHPRILILYYVYFPLIYSYLYIYLWMFPWFMIILTISLLMFTPLPIYLLHKLCLHSFPGYW